MDKYGLEHLLSSYNWWMGASTVAVALGILGEYVAHFVFEKEARRNKWEMVISILFGVLVLGGVVGEYVFGEKLSQTSAHIQQMADAEVAQANNDAAQARKDAEITRRQSADTKERAARAEQHAAQQNVRASKALQAAETARENAERFRLQIAQANERAANAERETAKLNLRFSGRILADEQIKFIAGEIKPYAGQEFDVTTFWDLKEPLAFANRIYEALNQGGWKYIKPANGTFLLGGLAGVEVWAHPNAPDATKKGAQALVTALEKQGFEVRLKEEDSKDPLDTKIHLNVGTKE